MAASDQNYRNMKTLDILFALSCLFMLLTILGMFAQDFLKEYKREQRAFRDVELAMAERDLIRLMPLPELQALNEAEKAVPDNQKGELTKQQKAYHNARMKLREAKAEAKKSNHGGNLEAGSQAEKKVADAQEALDKTLEQGSEAVQAALKAEHALMVYLDTFETTADAVADAKEAVKKAQDEHATKIHEAEYNLSVADSSYRSKKADYDSKESLYYIAVDNPDTSKDELATLGRDLSLLRVERDDLKKEVDHRTRLLREAEKPVAAAEALMTEAEKADKEKRFKFQQYQKLVKQKTWTIADEILASPVMDMFNSPYKINQYTLEQYPIDYSFKHVTRYDRCTTCHLGMEKADYDPATLVDLTKENKVLENSLKRFRTALENRKDNGEGTAGFNIDDIPATLKTLTPSELDPSRIKEFAAHPRLDLFVDPNSPHPAERFGCTSCHSGQGSATDFQNASHTPNSPEEKKLWEQHHGWFNNHYWDYPMQATRFTESSCLKCHHQVTDLIRYGSKEEAPKLIQGYNLVRENGCFGCHEISGLNKGRQIGPDMRLEPGIPLDAMSALRKAEVLADASNPPGTFRKVGPSLFRLNEKTNPTWLAQWLQNPRGFRPDTRMPHFYGLSNNSREELIKTASGQEEFPDAEIQSIVTYLTFESQKFLGGKDGDSFRRNNLARQEQLRAQGAKPSKTSGKKDDKELAELIEKLQEDNLPTLELRNPPPKSLKDQIVDHNGRTVTLPEWPKDAVLGERVKNGARLFMERGCLACHQHSGPAPKEDDNSVRQDGIDLKKPVVSDAHFGPNLSRLASKLVANEGDGEPKQIDLESARRWLVQWLLDPTIHFPRTRMPVTYLNEADANDVALYLLKKSEAWDNKPEPVPQPSADTLARLTAVYLQRVRPMADVDNLLSIESPSLRKTALPWT